MKLRTARRPVVIAAASITVLALGLTGTAAAKALITSTDIKDGTIQSVDVKNNSLTGADIKTGSLEGGDLRDGTIGSSQLRTGAVGSGQIANGAVRFGDLADSAVNQIQDGVFVGENWGVVDRNTIGAAFAWLRQGPTTKTFARNEKPPIGTGSLALQVLDSASKVDFGNEVDFVDKPFVSTLNDKIGFSVFTSENPTKLPAIRIEVDPNLSNGATNFTTAVFVPSRAAVAGKWTSYDATNSADGSWFLTGDTPTGAGTLSGCNKTTPCSFTTLKGLLDDATIISVAVGKGRDDAFLGAVDALKIGSKVYDFESRGVIARNS